MAQKESNFLNMFLTLLVITGVAALALGGVYTVTKAPIEAAKKAKQEAAIQMVVPGFANKPGDEAIELTSDDGLPLKLFPARDASGALIGVAMETVTMKGFSGEIKVMVGFKPDGEVINYQVLEHKETPGLGTKMADWFKTDVKKQSILGKNPSNTNFTVSKDGTGGEVDAITAATISSRAFLDAVTRAHKAFMDYQTKQGGQLQ
ncbi:MAG: RnfABCDGE type electron transport complex subunit G [Bacteroidales bacterium]|jgi:electron transport complex protein RnfG|nr:RnfABCDGE type electron transport complex subunit G [Bacteroidales bacterium]MDD3663722.1 RnfABCDGE type electron transport complex subunit G [Bacteroidales bacterium]